MARGFLNKYEFDLVRSNGEKASDGGLTLLVFAPNMVAARDKLMYTRRKQGWKDSQPKIMDVKLEQTAWGHVRGHKTQENEQLTIWYNNKNVGLALRIG